MNVYNETCHLPFHSNELHRGTTRSCSLIFQSKFQSKNQNQNEFVWTFQSVIVRVGLSTDGSMNGFTWDCTNASRDFVIEHFAAVILQKSLLYFFFSCKDLLVFNLQNSSSALSFQSLRWKHSSMYHHNQQSPHRSASLNWRLNW